MKNIDMSNYNSAPNGITNVLTTEAARKQLRNELEVMRAKGEEPLYVCADGELRQVNAARKAGLPVALIGSQGLGKTTLVTMLAFQENIPLITIPGNRQAKLYDLLGYLQEIGDTSFYKDGPVSLAARAQEKCILYVDEATQFTSNVFTSLSSLLDHRKMIVIGETGEAIPTSHLDIILAFNPPPVEKMDELPSPATLDRIAVVRFPEMDGAAAINLLNQKYSPSNDIKIEKENNPMNINDAINKYGHGIKAVYDLLRNSTGPKYESVIAKSVGPRSMENAFRLIAAGLKAQEAIKIAMINPMAPVNDVMTANFLQAAEQLIDTQFGVC